MKILLNLLPADKKTLTEQRMRFRFFVWQVFLLFSLELFFLGILLGAYTLLSVEQKHQETLSQEFDQYRDEEKRLKIFEERFRETNKRVDVSFMTNKEHFLFSTVFLVLDRHMNDAVILERVTTKDFQLSISGVAQTRDDLIAFNESLESEACFSDVHLPLSNLLAQKQVSFQMDITLKNDCLHDTKL